MSRASLLCVHPHPDDESIACGGVLARAVDQGRRVTVVTCTRGEAGENLAGIDLGGHDLVAHRERELADALMSLGVREHVYLGYRDSGMAGTEENRHPEAFARADLYEAATRLARVLRRIRPDVVVSDDERGTYGHPDHVQAHRVTERAVALAADEWWETPEDGDPWQVARRYVHTISRARMLEAHRWLLEHELASPFGDDTIQSPEQLPFGVDDAVVTTRVDIRPWLDRKRAAMAAHRSQIGEDSFFLNVSDEAADRLFGTEEFVLTSGDAGEAPDDDLLGGLDPA